MKQLSAPAGQLRNAAGAMLITLFTAPTWAEMADRQLQLFRVLRGEDRIAHARLAIIPRTCNADVLELARYWTEQLARIGSDAADTHARLVYTRWPDVVGNVVQFAKRGYPRATYPLNAEFWTALAMLAQSDACHQIPAPWAFQTPPTPPKDRGPITRNATPEGTTVELPDAKTYEDAAVVQRDFFVNLRGAEDKTGVLGIRAPRTTIGDVRQLAVYWSQALRKVGDPNFADISHSTVLERWRAAAADVHPPRRQLERGLRAQRRLLERGDHAREPAAGYRRDTRALVDLRRLARSQRREPARDDRRAPRHAEEPRTASL